MKKLITVLTVLLLLAGMAISAYAQGEPIFEGNPEGYGSGMENPTYAQDEPEADINIDNREISIVEPADPMEAHEPRLADGTTGRGTIDAPDKYWAVNGYPDNISFAFEAGGEMLDDGTSVAYWEIGIVNADEASKQEIIDLVSPNCHITFRDCTFSYKQREAAFNEIYASCNDIVRDVQMILNSEVILVEIADGYEKEYARKYVEQYGWFVGVTNDINAAVNNAVEGGGFDKGIDKNNPFGIWFFPMCLIFLIGTATVVFFKRTRLIPAMQTANGNVVTGNAPVSTKQTIAAIKNSALTPSDDVFKAIMEKVNNEKK
jgi:hypothetical protein